MISELFTSEVEVTHLPTLHVLETSGLVTRHGKAKF
jgi:hypothetical protein